MLKCIVSFVCFIKIWVFCIWPISLRNLEISLKWMILENLLKISTKWQISKNHLNLPKSTIIFLFGFSKKKKTISSTSFIPFTRRNTGLKCRFMLFFWNMLKKRRPNIFRGVISSPRRAILHLCGRSLSNENFSQYKNSPSSTMILAAAGATILN